MTADRAVGAGLQDIVGSCRQIADYVSRGHDAFVGDGAILDAIVFRLVTIGEASKALQLRGLDKRMPGLPWSSMARTRDRLTHHYFRIDPAIVWDTATKDIPELQRAVEAALAALGKGDRSQ